MHKGSMARQKDQDDWIRERESCEDRKDKIMDHDRSTRDWRIPGLILGSLAPSPPLPSSRPPDMNRLQPS